MQMLQKGIKSIQSYMAQFNDKYSVFRVKIIATFITKILVRLNRLRLRQRNGDCNDNLNGAKLL